MSNVLVTGGLGFIGSHLVDRLVKDHDVYVIDDCSTGSLMHINKKACTVVDYILGINEGFEFPDIDIIYHLAAESRIPPSLKYPRYTFRTNVMGTVDVCEFARKQEKQCKVIYAGSCTAEDKYLNPYALSKYQGEEVCKMYNKVYGVPVSIARFFNVYGPRHYREGGHATVLGIFEKQYMEEKSLTVTGSGSQRRDFIHVSDVVDGLIAISETECHGDIYNFGFGKSHAILDIARMFNTDMEYIDQPSCEMYNVKADIDETVYKLRWIPKIKIEDYIKEFVDENRV